MQMFSGRLAERRLSGILRSSFYRIFPGERNSVSVPLVYDAELISGFQYPISILAPISVAILLCYEVRFFINIEVRSPERVMKYHRPEHYVLVSR